MHPPRIPVLVTIIGALVAGCSPAPVETPAPVPSVPTCTPEFGGTPYPCTQAEYEANQKSLERYAEAERVYREFMRLLTEETVARRPEPSPELLALAGGAMKDALPKVRTASLEQSVIEGEVQILSMVATPHESDQAGNLAMIACVDRSRLTVTTDGKSTPRGVTPDRIVFDDASGTTVVVSTRAEEGATCD